MNSLLIAAISFSTEVRACLCDNVRSQVLHPVSLDSANRDTRVVVLGLNTAPSTDLAINVDGEALDSFDVVQDWSTNQSLTVITFHEVLPPLADVMVVDAGNGAEYLTFTTSDLVDEEDPTWSGGVERTNKVRAGHTSKSSPCSEGPIRNFFLEGLDDDLTPADDLLVEATSEYGETLWSYYSNFGGQGEVEFPCGPSLPSLSYDLNQRFEVTLYDEAGKASETHTVGGCGSCATGGSIASGLLALLPGLAAAFRRRGS